MRHGSAGRFPTRAHVILNRFELHDTDLLGAGSESRVYAMDDEHVLRIYHEQIPWDYVEARQAFYSTIASDHLPFAVPEVHTIGAWMGHIYTVEKRIPGQDFGKVLPTLEGAERSRALSHYLDAAATLSTVRFDDKPYGELITHSALHTESWQAYLRTRLEHELARSRRDLEQDLPGLDDVLAAVYAQMPVVGDTPPKTLVHGDYFPANVFVEEDLTITGVGDFSYATVVGDARMDWAGAVWLMGASADYRAEDSAYLRQQVAERWGEDALAAVDFYRLYYSLYFSGCKGDDPATYWWCVGNLKGVAR